METRLYRVTRALLVGLTVLGFAACDRLTDEDRDEHGGQKVAIDQVPPAVKATIEQESKGGTVKEIDKLPQLQDGKTVYSVDIVMNGKEQETLISEYGRVIVRRVHRKDEDDD